MNLHLKLTGFFCGAFYVLMYLTINPLNMMFIDLIKHNADLKQE